MKKIMLLVLIVVAILAFKRLQEEAQGRSLSVITGTYSNEATKILLQFEKTIKREHLEGRQVPSPYYAHNKDVEKDVLLAEILEGLRLAGALLHSVLDSSTPPCREVVATPQMHELFNKVLREHQLLLEEDVPKSKD